MDLAFQVASFVFGALRALRGFSGTHTRLVASELFTFVVRRLRFGVIIVRILCLPPLFPLFRHFKRERPTLVGLFAGWSEVHDHDNSQIEY